MNTFIIFFLISTVISSAGIAAILLIKKVFDKHISAKWHYSSGLLYFALLSIPFIPSGFFASLSIGSWNFVITTPATAQLPVNEGAASLYGANVFRDYAVSVERFTGNVAAVLFVIWVVGVIAFLMVTIYYNRNLRLIRESVKPITDSMSLSLFQQCKLEVGVKRNISLGASVIVKTPMTIGILKPLIILPAIPMTQDNMRYVMLHELMHCKKMDIHINGLLCVFQILYWFNPLVYIAFRQMRLDRELACDASILSILPRETHSGYGQTLLAFVKPSSVLTLAANIGDSKPHIIKRITQIALYKGDLLNMKLKSICLFVVLSFFVLAVVPAVSAFASDGDRFRFESENVQYSDFSHFFGEFDGAFVLYDASAGLYTIHNRDMSVTRVSPNSTYKIFGALIALETGILEVGNTFREWNGAPQPFESWNRSQDLSTAMLNSVNWYFQDFDAQIGLEQIGYYLGQIAYGNLNLSGGVDFWIESSLRISPLEQVVLLADLYRNNTVFEDEHENTVKETLVLSESNGTVLSGKTGTGLINDSAVNGWFIGFVETAEGTFVFATYIRGEGNIGGSTAAQITLDILENLGIK